MLPVWRRTTDNGNGPVMDATVRLQAAATSIMSGFRGPLRHIVVDQPLLGADGADQGNQLAVPLMRLVAVERGARFELRIEHEVRRVVRTAEVGADLEPNQPRDDTDKRLESCPDLPHLPRTRVHRDVVAELPE